MANKKVSRRYEQEFRSLRDSATRTVEDYKKRLEGSLEDDRIRLELYSQGPEYVERAVREIFEQYSRVVGRPFREMVGPEPRVQCSLTYILCNATSNGDHLCTPKGIASLQIARDGSLICGTQNCADEQNQELVIGRLNESGSKKPVRAISEPLSIGEAILYGELRYSRHPCCKKDDLDRIIDQVDQRLISSMGKEISAYLVDIAAKKAGIPKLKSEQDRLERQIEPLKKKYEQI